MPVPIESHIAGRRSVDNIIMSHTLQLSSEDVYAKHTALDRVGADAQRCWATLREEWKVDKEFILKALTESPSLPPKSEFERLFPQSLRFDRDVVLAFTKRPDFIQLFEERHLYCPGILTGDKEVMLAYCTSIPRSLQECSEGMLYIFVTWVVFWHWWQLLSLVLNLKCEFLPISLPLTLHFDCHTLDFFRTY